MMVSSIQKNFTTRNISVISITFLVLNDDKSNLYKFLHSLIKNSESVKKNLKSDYSEIPKINRNVSINSISKLNLKQIVFNKKNKFIKEEAKEMTIIRYKID